MKIKQVSIYFDVRFYQYRYACPERLSVDGEVVSGGPGGNAGVVDGDGGMNAFNAGGCRHARYPSAAAHNSTFLLRRL